jgi:hypothetical protein
MSPGRPKVGNVVLAESCASTHALENSAKLRIFEGNRGLPSRMAAKLTSADKVVAEAVALAPW